MDDGGGKLKISKGSANMIKLFVGQKIAEFRRKQRISQERLAEQIKVSTPTISRLENDKQIMKIDIMLEFCKTFNITPNDLFGYESVWRNEKSSISKRVYLPTSYPNHSRKRY